MKVNEFRTALWSGHGQPLYCTRANSEMGMQTQVGLKNKNTGKVITIQEKVVGKNGEEISRGSLAWSKQEEDEEERQR